MHILDNAFAIMFLSFMVGVFVEPLLRGLKTYKWLSESYLFANSKSYERIGVLWFRTFLLSTPLKLFNSQIRISKNRDLEFLRGVRQHMATAEVSHWVGFASMLGMTVFVWWYRGTNVGLAYLAFNLLGNVYPCLLQQYNKRRLGGLIAALEVRDAAQRVATQSAKSDIGV